MDIYVYTAYSVKGKTAVNSLEISRALRALQPVQAIANSIASFESTLNILTPDIVGVHRKQTLRLLQIQCSSLQALVPYVMFQVSSMQFDKDSRKVLHTGFLLQVTHR